MQGLTRYYRLFLNVEFRSQDATEEMESMVRAEANPDEIDLGDDEEEENVEGNINGA